ncbi:MAG: ApaG protein [Parasphingorhabdus sp.]|jgi:ApaG protein
MSEQLPKIEISIQTAYIEQRSNPDEDRFFFTYTITIANSGVQTVQLLSRHWIITDANDNVQEVRGDGVVGQQPHIQPGNSFEYTSGTFLATPVGTMRGSYQMLSKAMGLFDAQIPEFVLSFPRTLH